MPARKSKSKVKSKPKPKVRPRGTPRAVSRAGTGSRARKPAPVPTPEPEVTAVTSHVLKPPPRELHSAIVSRPVATPAYIRASQSLLEALGGEQSLIDTISDLSDPKAIQLVERMRTPAFAAEPFAQKLVMCDVRMDVLLRLYTEGRRARALAKIIPDTDEVLAGISARARDKVVRCTACRNGGWELDEETGEQTDRPCWPCEGTGWVLREADQAAIKTFLEVTGVTTSGPNVLIEANRTFNQQNNGGQTFVGAGGPTAPPDIASIIKRADRQLIALPAPSEIPEPMLPGQRSVNDALEAEVVGE